MKRLTREDQDTIAELIKTEMRANGDKIEWSQISDLIKAKFDKPIKNWLDVRGALQILINERLVKRTNNVHEEIYIMIPAEIVQRGEVMNKIMDDMHSCLINLYDRY